MHRTFSWRPKNAVGSIGRAILTVGMGVMLSCGCSVEPETLKSITEVVGRSTGSEWAATVGQPLAESPAKKQQKRTDDNAASSSFQPHYPLRTNPFLYPADASEVSPVPTSTSVAEIRVMGFANVRQPALADPAGDPVAATQTQQRVLLKTSVGIKSLSVGDQVGQIQVLRISPPAVELKMGSLTWIATMFDR